MLQIEMIKWQGLTPCNGSLCSSVPAPGSMPLCNDSKGWTRSTRRLQNSQHEAQEGRSKDLPGWLWYPDLALVLGGYYVISRGHFQPIFSYAKYETLRFASQVWQQMGSFLQSQWVLNCSSKQHPFLRFPALLPSLACQLPHSWPGVLPNWDTFPVTLIPQKICFCEAEISQLCF